MIDATEVVKTWEMIDMRGTYNTIGTIDIGGGVETGVLMIFVEESSTRVAVELVE